MAYDREFLRVTFGFTVNSSEEIANTSLNFSVVGGAPTWEGARESLDEFDFTNPLVPQACITALSDLMLTGGLNWAAYSVLRTIRMAAVGVDGHEQGAALVFEDITPATGTTQATIPQASLVLTLRSGMTTGSANTGRMYLPHCFGVLNTSQATMAPSATGAFATAAANFINAVTTSLDAGTIATLRPFIMTNKTGQASKEIVIVSVGSVNDTQRRRRNRLPEIYSSVAL